MCGILGVAVRHQAEISKRNPADALRAIRHRGPDNTGEYRDSNLWLGHVRLSILDLSSDANQPMATRDGRYRIVYNGEIYNFREVASSLALRELRTHSDTEVVLEAFARLGPSSLPLLNGMFAFAAYDREERKIWLVRDRLGIKPLYFRFDGDTLAFASEIGPLNRLWTGTPICDASSLHEWLYFGTNLGPRTIYQGIRKLLPGHFLEVDLRRFTMEQRPYWSARDKSKQKSQL